MLRIALSILLFFFACHGSAQPANYSTSHAHSHNDYENARPFHAAYEHGFGSIEADIFLQNGVLMVAHDTRELSLNRSLEEIYLLPLDSAIRSHDGHAYANYHDTLHILIDVKTEAKSTLAKLIETLRKFPALIHTPSLHWVISGNRPPQDEFVTYPSYIRFDGVISQTYGSAALKKIDMMSDNFKSYSNWNGMGELPDEDRSRLQQAISRVHALKIPVRFWNAPDQPNAWTWFIKLKSDYINTDHIPELAEFLHETAAKGNGE